MKEKELKCKIIDFDKNKEDLYKTLDDFIEINKYEKIKQTDNLTEKLYKYYDTIRNDLLQSGRQVVIVNQNREGKISRAIEYKETINSTRENNIVSERTVNSVNYTNKTFTNVLSNSTDEFREYRPISRLTLNQTSDEFSISNNTNEITVEITKIIPDGDTSKQVYYLEVKLFQQDQSYNTPDTQQDDILNKLYTSLKDKEYLEFTNKSKYEIFYGYRFED